MEGEDNGSKGEEREGEGGKKWKREMDGKREEGSG